MPLIEEQDGYRITTHDNGAVEKVLINAPPAVPPVLTITLNKALAAVGEHVQATAEVRGDNGDLVPITGTYHVPVVREADGLQVRFLSVPLVGGAAVVDFTIPEPGAYQLPMSKIKPLPQSRLGATPELIVTEA